MAVRKTIKNANIYLIIAGVMMLILFITSSQTFEQQDQTTRISKILGSEPFLEQLKGLRFNYGGSEVSIAASGYTGVIQFFIRKVAHFSAYFIIGGGLYLGLVPRIKQLFLTASLSWLAATGYAALDEYHQLLTGGRSALFEDIVLDSAGAGTAILICLTFALISYFKKR